MRTNRIALAFVVILSALLFSACSKTGRKPALASVARTQKAAPRPAAATSARAESATPAANDALAADIEKARTILVNYGGDGADLDAAKKIIYGVLERNRDYAPAYVELARLEFLSGYLSGDRFERTQLINADKFVGHAISLDPKLPRAYRVRALIQTYLGEFDGAKDSIATAESLGLPADEVAGVRAEIADEQHDDKTALRLARTVVASDSASAELKGRMLDVISPILERGGFRSDAQDALEKAVALEPHSAWAHGNLAAFLLRHDDAAGAVDQAERAVAITRYPLAVSVLARAYLARAGQLYDAGQFGEAGRMIERFSKNVGTGHPEPLRMLGDYYYAIFVRTSDPKYLDRAAEQYRASLALDPKQPEVSTALQRVLKRRAELRGGS